MKRIFTEESLQELKQMIESINAEEQNAVADWFGDRFLAIKHFFGKIGLYNPMDDIQKYHQEVLDQKNLAVADIESIYEAISKLDTRYGTNDSSGFPVVIDVLEDFRDTAARLAELNLYTARLYYAGRPLSDCFSEQTVTSVLLGPADANERSRCFFTDQIDEISDEDKDSVILEFERANPEIAAQMNQLMSNTNLTDEERRDIRFLTYSAPEPYRSVYLQHLQQYVYVIGENGGWFNSAENRIYLFNQGRSFEKDPRGAYNTYFHESGHAVDFYESGTMTSRQYVYNGQTLHDIVVSDTRNYVNRYIDEKMPELTAQQREQLLRSLNLTDDAGFQYGGTADGLDSKMRSYRDKLIRDMHEDLKGTANQSPSDVYGGVTNNAIKGNWGHQPNEQQGQKPEDYDYWYDHNTHQVTQKQESELWAEFNAAQMTHDYEQLESIRRHFPQAYEAMLAMAQQMGAN